MKNLYTNENLHDFYAIMLIDIFDYFDIIYHKEYQFVYDEFLEHLILDSEDNVKNNHNEEKYPGTIMTYRRNIFNLIFRQHIHTKIWYNKIYHPENCPEYTRKIRTNKLKKINDTI